TGYDVYVWINPAENCVKIETTNTLIKNGDDIPWRFETWRIMREKTYPCPNKLNIQISDKWESLQGILVDRESTETYNLRPKIDHITHRITCDVKLEANVKIVTLQSSTTLHNGTRMVLEIMTTNVKGHMTCSPQILDPGEDFHVPIIAAYHDIIYFRPEEKLGYNWSTEALFWQDLQLEKNLYTLCTCTAKDKALPSFYFQINSSPKGVRKNYPSIEIKFIPPLQLENLLPYSFKYAIIDKNTMQLHVDALRNGDIETIHTLNPNSLLTMHIEIPDTAVGSSFALVIPPDQQGGLDTHLGVTVKEGDGKFYLSKVVTFTPRFIVCNNSSEEVEVHTSGESSASLKPIVIVSKQSSPLLKLPTNNKANLEIRLRLKGFTNEMYELFKD
ncbi:hypothetical protein HK096_006899, partial [Nowakowskiella sp. JEL0078]